MSNTLNLPSPSISQPDVTRSLPRSAFAQQIRSATFTLPSLLMSPFSKVITIVVSVVVVVSADVVSVVVEACEVVVLDDFFVVDSEVV